MQPSDYPNWPTQFPRTLSIPATSLPFNLEVSARRYPDKSALVFYDSALTYAQLLSQVTRLAAYLRTHCGIRRGDRVLLDMQNCPQWAVAYYAILRADAVAVPVSPMNVTDELEHYFSDSGARCAILSQDLLPRFTPLLGSLFDHAVVATYSEYLTQATEIQVPSALKAPCTVTPGSGIHTWQGAMQSERDAMPPEVGPDDLCSILYTSGTTGKPKGCMHTHRTVMTTAVGAALWQEMRAESVILATAPMFHVTGMQHSLNAPLYAGGTIVLLPRWDPTAAGDMIERYHCTHWANVPTMVVDLLADPQTQDRDLTSMRTIFGGGASMPESVAQKLFERCGVRYMEAYGMTETISQTHMNPPNELRKQCLGIPTFDTRSIVVDPETLRPAPANQAGEILSTGPQLFKGYWRNEAATTDAMVEIDGVRYLRTGDLGRIDESGFFYIADRLKRMINASGYKVWPAEVEAVLYQHPAIKEVAIISAPDERRGETVKACVVLREGAALTEKELIDWSREHMAVYKIPRRVAFLDALPRSASGKIQWRALQEQEWQG